MDIIKGHDGDQNYFTGATFRSYSYRSYIVWSNILRIFFETMTFGPFSELFVQGHSICRYFFKNILSGAIFSRPIIIDIFGSHDSGSIVPKLFSEPFFLEAFFSKLFFGTIISDLFIKLFLDILGGIFAVILFVAFSKTIYRSYSSQIYSFLAVFSRFFPGTSLS